MPLTDGWGPPRRHCQRRVLGVPSPWMRHAAQAGALTCALACPEDQDSELLLLCGGAPVRGLLGRGHAQAILDAFGPVCTAQPSNTAQCGAPTGQVCCTEHIWACNLKSSTSRPVYPAVQNVIVIDLQHGASSQRMRNCLCCTAAAAVSLVLACSLSGRAHLSLW